MKISKMLCLIDSYSGAWLCAPGHPEGEHPGVADRQEDQGGYLVAGYVIDKLLNYCFQGFYTVTESNTFEEGAKSCLTLAGLGKLSPNMILMGFKADWTEDLELTREYFSVLQVTLVDIILLLLTAVSRMPLTSHSLLES